MLLSHLSQVHQVLQHKPDSWINLLCLNNVTHSVEVLLHQVLHKEKDILNQLLTVSHAFPCMCTLLLSWSISFPMVDISLAKHSRDSPSEDDLSSLILHSCMMASESSYGREREGGMRKEGWRLHVRGDGAQGMQSWRQSTKHFERTKLQCCSSYLVLKQFSNKSNVPKRPVTGLKLCFFKHLLSLLPLLILQEQQTSRRWCSRTRSAPPSIFLDYTYAYLVYLLSGSPTGRTKWQYTNLTRMMKWQYTNIMNCNHVPARSFYTPRLS